MRPIGTPKLALLVALAGASCGAAASGPAVAGEGRTEASGGDRGENAHEPSPPGPDLVFASGAPPGADLIVPRAPRGADLIVVPGAPPGADRISAPGARRQVETTVLARAGGTARAVADGEAEAETSASEALARAREAYDNLEYEAAVAAARAAASDLEATTSQRLEALEIAGLSHLILGDEAAASEVFSELLEIDPHYELTEDTGSPRIREFFEAERTEAERARAGGAAFAELVHSSPVSARAGELFDLEVAAGRGAGAVAEVVVGHRRRGEDEPFREARLRRREADAWEVAFPLPASNEPYVLEYYIEARGGGGEPMGSVGSRPEPLSVAVRAGGAEAVAGAEPTPWYRRWYVLGGALALGAAGVAAGVAAQGDGLQGSLDPGRITLTP